MKITKEYCDRCHKEVINEEALDKQGYILTAFKRKPNLLRFSERPSYFETTHIVCYDCYKQFIEWWANKKYDEVVKGEM